MPNSGHIIMKNKIRHAARQVYREGVHHNSSILPKIKYYGLFGRLIRRALQTVITEPCVAQKDMASKDISELDYEVKINLITQDIRHYLVNCFNAVLIDMRTTVDGTPDDDFEEYINLVYASKEHCREKKMPNFGLEPEVSSGIDAAISNSILILMAMKDYLTCLGHKPDVLDTISKSHGPITQLAALNGKELENIQNLITKSRDIFAINDRGKIIFAENINASIKSSLEKHDDTIGCPILLAPRQIQEFWQWICQVAHQYGLI